ncbi:conjugal transfer protein [Nocardia mangyaensis]|uniref:conjugal transfer protein n=1 Tax=Nocardia mangyaensis TaxID=2213200 RepID=UPI002676FB47|nr:conjugal transfer protein [Nocardia mangyaensis]MDO3648252.1 conjugal transfer protein [Nocardia mangyaensis]
MRKAVNARVDSGDALLRRMVARRRRDNLIFTVLAGLAILGGGHAVLSWFSEAPPGPSDDTTVSIVGNAALAGSFAQEFVVAYLGATAGDQDRIADFLGGGNSIGLPATARQVSDPAVVSVRRTRASTPIEIWSVTVSVRPGNTPNATGAKQATARSMPQYYRVGVAVNHGRLRALSRPWLVAPPAKGQDLLSTYSAPCGAESPVADVAVGFLDAFLTGSGDVTRYTSHDSGIAALRPAPFTEFESVSVSAEDSSCGAGGSRAQVLATVTPVVGADTLAPLDYPLTMVRVEEQWQVQTIDSIPALPDPIAVVSGDATAVREQSAAPTTSSSPSVTVPPATQN